MDIKLLIQTIDRLFTKRSSFVALQQEIAENFYPERADFTVTRSVGEQYASHLTTSFPVQCRRDLGDQIGSMLRPVAKDWAHVTTRDPEREDNDGKRWLEYATSVQRKAMYDPVAKFTKAMKQGDHDFAAFGNAVKSVRLNRYRNALLYRCWHIRDVVWMEGEDGEICLIARKWKPTNYDLTRDFGDKNHPAVARDYAKEPFGENDCLHIVISSEMYDAKTNQPWMSIYFDKTHDHKIEEVATYNREYWIPRWQTVSGSQYAFSPATIIALPDARTIQAIGYTLLEAGEKTTNPPLVATKDAVKSDVAIYPGGLTWVDFDYDERAGEALRQMPIDARGMPIGIEMERDRRALIEASFFLNKLRPFLPTNSPEMTAFQAGQIVAQYIRDALPIFEPMEMEDNGACCELTFNLLLRNGAFGSPFNIPPSLRDAKTQFRFESPLHDAIEQQKGHQFMEAKGLLAEALALDQTAVALIDAKVALRDALSGIGVPAKWIRSETTVEQITDAQKAAAQSQAVLAAMETGSNVAANLAGAQKDLAAA